MEWFNLYVQTLSGLVLGGDEECVPGRINANLRSEIRDANKCN